MTATAAPPKNSEAFPRLTAAQIARIEPHGTRRTVAAGEVLGEAGEPVTKIFVVVSGRLDIARSPRWVGEDVPTLRQGVFTRGRLLLSEGPFLPPLQPNRTTRPAK